MIRGMNQNKSVTDEQNVPATSKSKRITSKRDIDGYGTDESANIMKVHDESKNRKLKEFKKILKRKDGNIQFDDDEEEAEAIDQQVISENRKNMKKSCCVIFPDSNFRTCWDLISFLFIIYQSILIPFRISFEQDAAGGFFYFETVIDVFFISEIFITFNTGYYRNGNLVMQRKYIILNYVRTWFILDLFASFPYSYVIQLSSNNDNSSGDDEDSQSGSSTSEGSSAVYKTPQLLRLLRIVRFLRILRLLRVLKLRKLLMRLEDYIVSDKMNALVKFLKLMLIIIFIAHWIA